MIKLKKKTPLIDQHDKFGFYGNKFGGNFCAETMRKPIEDLAKLFEKLRKSKKFLRRRDHYFKNYLGGETPFFKLENLYLNFFKRLSSNFNNHSVVFDRGAIL